MSPTRTTKDESVRRFVFSSATDDWATPQWLFDQLDEEFHFALDVCASKSNHKARSWYGLDHTTTSRRDGLARDWARDADGRGAVWMNPPYGRTIGAWMAKAREAAENGATVVCLVPARTDTHWFHEQVLAAGAEVRYLRGRVKFGDATNGAPFASLVVIYRPALTRSAVA